nr:hypothetical protein [Sphingomonas sediminicola]
MGDELEDRRPELRGLPVRLADDHVAAVAERSVPPIFKCRSGGVHVDARARRVAVEPPQPLEVDGDLAGAVTRTPVQDGDRVVADDSVGLQAIFGLQAFDRRGHCRRVTLARARLAVEVAVRD